VAVHVGPRRGEDFAARTVARPASRPFHRHRRRRIQSVFWPEKAPLSGLAVAPRLRVRIGLFGNTNNNPLLLALGLRRLGHEAVLVVNRKERIHRPESKFPEFEQRYPEWMLDCSDLSEDDFVWVSPRLESVLTFLTWESSGLVLNDLGPSLLEFCSLPSIALLTGSDLTYYANPKTTSVRYGGCAADYRETAGARLGMRAWDAFIERQRSGIRNATVVSTAIPGLVPEMDHLLRDIGVPDSRRDSYYMAFGQASTTRPTQAARPLRVVNGARLNWKPLPDGFCGLDHKATDVLLEGFAAFISSGGDADLVLFRKGLHIAETEALASSLGIASRIIWRDQVTLDEFHAEILQADIVCDQLGETFPGMVSLDAMSFGLPVIANFRPEINHSLFPKPVAACQARTSAEVTAHLTALAASPDARARAGRAAQDFARRHFSPIACAERCARDLGQQLRDVA
jgi:glycosyltransferase involved in cell wall biosynthesis